MPEQVQKPKPAPRKEEQTDDLTVKERSEETEALLSESSDWLDEIDEALEGLDQDLAAQFTQVGGE